jgi:peptide-methionine (S)-S-oxide reductase
MAQTQEKTVATLAGGCFWCMEAVYDQLRGVVDVVSGYSGGRKANPTYEQVCAGRTGHAEVVQIAFDSSITFRQILEVFFTVHDPTTLNRQGSDVGTQYRSAIFYHSAEQKQVAEQVIAELSAAKLWPAPIVTQVTPFEAFYPAEDYHQEYFVHHPESAYCRVVIEPKVAKFHKHFLDSLRKRS